MTLTGKKICAACGSDNIRFGGGHFDRYELNKCLGCGQIEPNLEVKPDPCWVCGNTEPTICWSMLDGWGGHFGEFTGIPGVPDELNLCGYCQEAAKQQIIDTVRGLMEEGWDGSM